MLFKRRNRLTERARASSQDDPVHGGPEELFYVPFEQMLKGHIIKRGRETIRQCAIIIDGYMHLVTSGDHVSREVYLALVDKGYLAQSGKPPVKKGAPPVAGADEVLD